MRAILVGVHGLFERTVAVVDNPSAVCLRVADVPIGVVLAEERRIVVVVECRTVDPEQLVIRRD